MRKWLILLVALLLPTIGSAQSIRASITSGTVNETVDLAVDVKIPAGQEIRTFGFVVSFDEAVFKYLGLTPGANFRWSYSGEETPTGPWPLVAGNVEPAGVLIVGGLCGAADGYVATGSYVRLVTLRFRIISRLSLYTTRTFALQTYVDGIKSVLPSPLRVTFRYR